MASVCHKRLALAVFEVEVCVLPYAAAVDGIVRAVGYNSCDRWGIVYLGAVFHRRQHVVECHVAVAAYGVVAIEYVAAVGGIETAAVVEVYIGLLVFGVDLSVTDRYECPATAGQLVGSRHLAEFLAIALGGLKRRGAAFFLIYIYCLHVGGAAAVLFEYRARGKHQGCRRDTKY